MNSPAAAFHVAREAALRASTALAVAAGGTARIYADVPAGAVLPYTVHGNDQILLEESDCGTEAEIISTIGFWSRTKPLDKGAQARAMGAAIIAAVALELTVDGWMVDEWEVQSEQYSTDPDQSTHGVLVIRHLLTERTA